MRIRGAKTQLEDAGLETEGMVESTAKLREEIMALSGVDIMEVDGQTFKSTYAIMEELANKWQDLSDIQQASITELIAGKRQGNIVSALMTNFDIADNALKTSLDSSGSAMKEHEKWMQSLEAKLQQLQAAWQDLSQTFLSSDFLKFLLDGVINLVQGLEKLIDTMGVIPALFIAFGGYQLGKNGLMSMLFGKEFSLGSIGKLTSAFKGLFSVFARGGQVFAGSASLLYSFGGMSNVLKNLPTLFKNSATGASTLAGSLLNTASASGGATGAFAKLLKAIPKHPYILAAATAVGVLGYAYFKAKKDAEELSEEVDKLTSEYQIQHKELIDNKSSFESMASKYAELSKGVDGLGRNVSLTADEYSEYQSVVNDIAAQVPSLVSGYDSQGNAILSCKGNVEELTAAYEKLIHIQNNEILSNSGDIEKDFKNKLEDLDTYNLGDKGMTTSVAKGLEEMYNNKGKYTTRDDVFDYVQKNFKDKIGTFRKGVEYELEQAGIDTSDGVEAAIAETLKTNPDKIKSILDSFSAELDAAAEDAKTIAQATLSEAFDISGSDYAGMSDTMQNLVRQVVSGFDSEFYADLVTQGVNIEEYINGILDKFNNLSDTDNAEFEAALNLQTKFNNGDVSYGEYINGLKNAETFISSLDLDKEVKEQILLSLNTEQVFDDYNSLLNRLTSKEYEFQLDTESAESFINGLSSEELKVAIKFTEEGNEDFNNALQNYKDVLNEANEAGVNFSKTTYGNIDTNARQVLEWNSENLKKYKDELESWNKGTSWDKIKENYKDTISTVMGGAETYTIDGKEVDIAFSPMLQTESGAKVLSHDTVNTYINDIIGKATEDGKWSEKELLKLDAEGLEVDGQKIKGLLADIGDTAVKTSEQMHFVGKDGALALAKEEFLAIVEAQAKINEAMNFTIAMDVETESIEALNTAMAESVSGAGLSSEAIAALKGRYAELESQGYNLSAMFEETANGIHLNREAVAEFEQKLATDKLAETEGHLDVLKNRYDELTVEIDNCTDASERAALYREQKSIVDKINDLGTLASQYEGLASAYQKWQNIESAGSERDMYEGIIEGFENIEDELSRGWLDDGTIAFLELLTGKTDLASKSGKELKEIYDDLDETIKNTSYSVSDFFTVDDDGNSTNAGVYNFLDAIGQLEEEKFGGKNVVERDDSGNVIGFDFELVAQKDEKGNVIKNGDQVIAEALGISEELVQIMVRASDDAGFVVNLEGAYTQLADLKTEAETARDTLISLKKKGLDELKNIKLEDLNFNFEATGDDLVAEQEKAVELLDKFKKDGKVDLKMEGAQEALDVAEYLTIKLDDLTEPKFMQIDTSEVDEDLRDPIEKIQEIGDLCKQKHLVVLEGDTKEINEVQDKINATAKEIEELDPEVKAQIGIDDSWDSKTIANKIEKGEIEIPAELELDVQMSDDLKDMRLMMMNQLGLASDNEVKLKIGYDIDDSVVDKLTEEEKEVVVKYIADHEEIDNWSPEAKDAFVKYLVDGGDPEKFDPDDKDSWVVYETDTAKPDNYEPDDEGATVTYDKDSSVPDGYDPNDPNATVTYEKDSSEVDGYNPPNYERTVTFTAKIKKAASSLWGHLTETNSTRIDNKKGQNGVGGVDGTAYADGTTGKAFNRGNWGTRSSGTALVGELGRETLVRNGRYYTIGDNGAEFIKYQKDDIIFNHKQTEELFKNGKVTSGGGRGKALASGTAFLEGTAFDGGSNGSGGLGEYAGEGSSAKNYGKDNAKGKSKSTKDDFEETFDWIEIAIARVERAIDRLDQKANRTYKSWSSRNSNLRSEISKVGEEIDLQNKAYDRYKQERDSVGLSKSLAKKVRNGTIDISTITNEDTAKKVKEYQEWHDKMLECKDAIEDLKDKEAELYMQKFDNVSAKYDGILQGYEHAETMLNEYISQAEAKGHIVSGKYYDELAKNEKNNIAKLKKEQAALIAARDEAVDSGVIKKYSQDWYDMCAEIDGVTQAIEEANTNLLEYKKTMEEIDWDVFDMKQEHISDVTAESDFLIDLMSSKDMHDDKGKLTEQGAATLALHGLNHNVNMYQADDYGKEIADIDAKIASGELDKNDKDVINRRRELVELQRECILNAEDEKQAIKDLVEDGINKELDALQELIDKKNEELESERDLYEYQKKVKEQTEEIADLEKQMAAYSGDDSEESQAKIQELKVSLEGAKTELQETEWDKQLSDTSALLDNLYTEYESILNERLDTVDDLLRQVVDGVNSEGAISAALGSEGAIAQAIAGAVGENGSIQSILNKETTAVGTTLSTAMNNIWSVGDGNAKSVLTTYGQGFQDKQTTTNTVLGNIKTNVDNMVKASDKEAKEKIKTPKTKPSSKADPTGGKKQPAKQPSKKQPTKKSSGDGKAKVGDKVKFVSGKYYYDSYGTSPLGSKNQGKYVYITNINKKGSHPYHISTGSKLGKGDLGWLKLNQLSGYFTGKKKIENNEVAWTQEKGRELIVRPSDGAILTPVAKNDSILNAAASNNIWNMANSPAEFIKESLGLGVSGVPNGSNVQNTYTQNLGNVVFNMPNVKNYDEMLTQMQRDKDFEKLIMAMTIDRVAGKSSLAKNKVIK